MRILTRYILKEVASHSLLGLLVFTFVIFVPHIGSLLEIVARHNLPSRDILTLVLLQIPGILVITIPMSVLVGTLIGLSRMAADGEVIAARASGIGLGQFVRPVMVFALFGWGLASWLSIWAGPQAARKLVRMEVGLKTSQVPFEIQPRVFLEQFPRFLVYLEDVTSSRSQWRGVFIADTTQRDELKITLAESGAPLNTSGSNRLMLHLQQGTTHQFDPRHPEQYSIISFNETDFPISLDSIGAPLSERRTPNMLPFTELLGLTSDARDRQAALVELNSRLALPVASIVLPLAGIPLGLFVRKGGKSVGVVLTILLVFLYYILMAFGWSLARQGRLDPALGLWLGNAVFGVAGLLILTQMHRFRMHVQFLLERFADLEHRIERWRHRKARAGLGSSLLQLDAPSRPFFQILDAYLLRGWLFYLAVLIVAFTGIYMIFDFFQLLGDFVRNHIGAPVVFAYFRYQLPQVVYLMLPLSILVATLVTFGLLTKSNELVAIKSAGISLYRVSVPILMASGLLSVGMFMLEDNYLPETNQRQDALRNQIKGRPPQTHYRPDRQWIFGRSDRIFNYRFFDPDQNLFANFSVFEFDPASFRVKRRIYATEAFWQTRIQGWVLTNGWVRDIEGDRVTNYMPFNVATFPELDEEPAYFKKEVKPSAQMSARELSLYIRDLRQSGFDVVRLLVQFYRKFSFPLIAFVVSLIGIPFALTTGSKGALSGIGLSIGIAIVYWSLSSLFEAMGNLNQLPPIVAAWSPDVLFGLGGAYLLLRVRT